MKLYPLSKTVLAIRNNAALFLNGLTSNLSDQPRNAFVNIHGRIVATFDQYRLNDDESVIAVERAFVEPLLAHLEKYIRLSGVRVEKLDRYVYFDVEETGSPVPEGTLVIPQRKGRALVSEVLMPTQVSDEEFILFRLRHNIPLQGVDYRDEFLLNLDDEGLVSYTKGCFLGQEPIAKVHNRSKPARKLVVRYQDQCSEEERQKMTSVVIDPAARRPMGFVFVRDKTGP